VAELFGDPKLVTRLSLSSVNSINWCRVLVQSVHYFYAYFRVCRTIGNPVVFSVPTGAFGNLFAGYLARAMGLPVHTFICSVNTNQTLSTVFATGLFKRWPLRQTLSSAIDIVVPYNFWRFLYFATGQDPEKIRTWMDRFQEQDEVQLPRETLTAITQGFKAVSITDDVTLETIARTHQTENGYLLDPHGAVALAGARKRGSDIPPGLPVVCLATAHPAKFPHIIEKALGMPVPDSGTHPSLILPAQDLPTPLECSLSDLKSFLIHAIGKRS
jgi:threonine synthase